MFDFAGFPAEILRLCPAGLGSDPLSSLSEHDINGFLCASHVGFWKLETEDGKKPRLYADGVVDSLLGVSCELSTEERYEFHLAHIHPSEHEVFGAYVSGRLADGKETIYRYKHPETGEIYLRCCARRYSAGEGAVYFVGYIQLVSGTVRLDSDIPTDYNTTLYVDELTGTNNHRFYEDVLRNMRDAAAVALIGLEDFKAQAGGLGQNTAGTLLKILVHTVKKNVRKNDVIVRLGSDTFLIVFPEMSVEDLRAKLEHIHEEVSFLAVPGLTNMRLSVSIGGVIKGEADNMDDTVSRAVRLMEAL